MLGQCDELSGIAAGKRQKRATKGTLNVNMRPFESFIHSKYFVGIKGDRDLNQMFQEDQHYSLVI